MRFLLDQNVEGRIAAFLSGQGHDATRIGQDYPAGLADPDVLAIAHREQRMLITNDKDFGELVVQRNLPHSGVILLRFPLDATAREKVAALNRLLETHQSSLSHILVVTPHNVRVR